MELLKLFFCIMIGGSVYYTPFIFKLFFSERITLYLWAFYTFAFCITLLYLVSRTQEFNNEFSQTPPEDRAENLISEKFNEITKNMNPDIVKRRKKELLIYASSLISEDKNSLEKIYQGISIQDYDKLIDDFHIREEKRLKNHISYEGRIGVRNKRILKEKLGYTCQACGLKMSEKYGNIGANYIELHHKVPYSQLQENDNRLLNENDFCVLCPNCHRMIHKLENAGDIELLKEILKSKSE